MYFARSWHSKSLPPLKNSVVRKEREKRLEQERENLTKVKAHIDTSVPKTYEQRKKFKATEKRMRGNTYHPSMTSERVRQIEKHNLDLLGRMVEICTSEPEYKTKPPVSLVSSSYDSNRKRELRRINRENKILLKRLEHQKKAPGVYSVKKWEEDAKSREKILHHMCVYPYQILDEWNERQKEHKQRLLQYPELEDLTPLAASAYALSLPGEPPIPKQRSVPVLKGDPQKLPPIGKRHANASSTQKRTRQQEWALVTLREDWSASSKELDDIAPESESSAQTASSAQVYSGKHNISSQPMQVEVYREMRSSTEKASQFVAQTVESYRTISKPNYHDMKFPTKEALAGHLIDDLADVETSSWVFVVKAKSEEGNVAAEITLPGNFLQAVFQGFPSLLVADNAGELAKFVIPFLSLHSEGEPVHRKGLSASSPHVEGDRWVLYAELGAVSALGLELEIERRLHALTHGNREQARELTFDTLASKSTTNGASNIALASKQCETAEGTVQNNTEQKDEKGDAQHLPTEKEPHSARSYHAKDEKDEALDLDTLSDI